MKINTCPTALKLYFSLLIFSFSGISAKEINSGSSTNFVKDTLGKTWISVPPIDTDSAQKIAQYHLDSNEIFKEFWINDVLFVYETLTYDDLPDSMSFTLKDENQEFRMNWYGQVNSPYGPRWGRMHHGIDLHLRTGDTVVSSFDGIVRYAKFNESGYGNCVIVRHFNGLETLYGHLSKLEVEPNQFVKAGQLLGLGGSTGRSDGPHLHFETRYKDFSINSFKYIDQETLELKSEEFSITKAELFRYRYPSEVKGKVTSPSAPKNTVTAKKTYSKTAITKKGKSNATSKKISTKTSKGTANHTVKSGESISVIAKKYGTNTSKILKLNGLKPNSVIKPGQKIKIK